MIDCALEPRRGVPFGDLLGAAVGKKVWKGGREPRWTIN